MRNSPSLRRRPDPSRVAQLEALESWTTQPTSSAVAEVSGGEGEGTPIEEGVPEPIEASPAPVSTPVAPEPTPAPPPKAVKKSAPAPVVPPAQSAPVRDKMPWEGLQGQTQPYHVILPKTLHVQLQWLASQHFGSSMRQDVIKVLTEYAHRELKERGYDPTGAE